MKFMKELAIIFGVSMVGELLNVILPLPVPAGVYGLFLLLILLCTNVVKLEDVERTGNFLLDTMPLMFIPVCVGLMESFSQVKAVLVPLAVISVVSTVAVMVVTGKVAELVLHRKEKKHE
ncbi:MAG: CidA/LrgA family protein [Lachnospiraceae bacterium]